MSDSPTEKTELTVACETLRKKLFEHKNLAVVVAATVERIVELQMNPDENQSEISECTGSIEFFMKQIKDQSIDMFETFNNFNVPR